MRCTDDISEPCQILKKNPNLKITILVSCFCYLISFHNEFEVIGLKYIRLPLNPLQLVIAVFHTSSQTLSNLLVKHFTPNHFESMRDLQYNYKSRAGGWSINVSLGDRSLEQGHNDTGRVLIQSHWNVTMKGLFFQ